jgi:1,2-diacylglycerol 3-beta-galactosyltransferase
MILRPGFYEPMQVDRERERASLGLDPALPTGLVLFGGHGSGVMEEIARRLDASELNVQLILICGRNEALAGRLRAPRRRIPMFVEGFTDRIAYYMRLSDFFIGKPGPGSISEALAMHLPVIVERNAWTLPQERYNAEWVRERGVGLVLNNFRQVERAVGEMVQPENLARFRAAAAAIENRAVFEIPELLEGILATTGRDAR